MNLIQITECKDLHKDEPLVIVGPGPSYDYVPEELWWNAPNVFALNATITKCWNHPGHLWVSNDHDRTFKTANIVNGLQETLKVYTKWRTTSNRKFLGKFGRETPWKDRHGVTRRGGNWTLRPPKGSDIYWYETMEGRPGMVRNGHSVLELALEVATIWGFNPIVLVGVDYMMVEGKRIIDRPLIRDKKNATYYAKQWRWKDTPKRMFNGKLVEERTSVESNFHRWNRASIYTTSNLWQGPFKYLEPEKLSSVLSPQDATS